MLSSNNAFCPHAAATVWTVVVETHRFVDVLTLSALCVAHRASSKIRWPAEAGLVAVAGALSDAGVRRVSAGLAGHGEMFARSAAVCGGLGLGGQHNRRKLAACAARLTRLIHDARARTAIRGLATAPACALTIRALFDEGLAAECARQRTVEADELFEFVARSARGLHDPVTLRAVERALDGVANILQSAAESGNLVRSAAAAVSLAAHLYETPLVYRRPSTAVAWLGIAVDAPDATIVACALVAVEDVADMAWRAAQGIEAKRRARKLVSEAVLDDRAFEWLRSRFEDNRPAPLCGRHRHIATVGALAIRLVGSLSNADPAGREPSSGFDAAATSRSGAFRGCVPYSVRVNGHSRLLDRPGRIEPYLRWTACAADLQTPNDFGFCWRPRMYTNSTTSPPRGTFYSKKNHRHPNYLVVETQDEEENRPIDGPTATGSRA